MKIGSELPEYYYRYSYETYTALKKRKCKTSILVVNKYLKEISERGTITDSNIASIINYLEDKFKNKKKKNKSKK